MARSFHRCVMPLALPSGCVASSLNNCAVASCLPRWWLRVLFCPAGSQRHLVTSNAFWLFVCPEGGFARSLRSRRLRERPSSGAHRGVPSSFPAFASLRRGCRHPTAIAALGTRSLRRHGFATLRAESPPPAQRAIGLPSSSRVACTHKLPVLAAASREGGCQSAGAAGSQSLRSPRVPRGGIRREVSVTRGAMTLGDERTPRSLAAGPPCVVAGEGVCGRRPRGRPRPHG